MARIGTIFILAFVIGSALPAAAQDDACPVIVETALATAGDVCSELGRNQLCYGNHLITAQDFTSAPVAGFAAAGDTTDVFSVASLATEGLDVDANVWGVALLALQADLPNTLPGQNVVFVVFGATELVNEVPPGLPITLSAESTGSINIRNGPGTEFAVVGSLAAGESVTLVGRNDTGDWVQLEMDASMGWVFAPLLTIEGEPRGLRIAAAGQASTPRFAAPMQSFRLQTGIGAPVCDEAPGDGVLVQAPSATTVHFRINGVEVKVGSTAYLQLENASLAASTIDGSVSLTSAGTTQVAEAGFRVDAALESPPTEPEPYDFAALRNLPVELLPEAVSIPIPVGSNSDWVDTGIELRPGDRFTLAASGIVNFWDFCPTQRFAEGVPDIDCSSLILGPEGGLPLLLDGEVLPIGPQDMQLFPVPDATPHSLAGRIGNTTFFVGEGGTFTAEDSGTLQFRVNDLDQNNLGAFVVRVEFLDED